MNMCKQGWGNNRHYIIVVPGTGESSIDSNLKAVESLGLNAYLFPCVYNDDLPHVWQETHPVALRAVLQHYKGPSEPKSASNQW
jgi:hypothetical protein